MSELIKNTEVPFTYWIRYLIFKSSWKFQEILSNVISLIFLKPIIYITRAFKTEKDYMFKGSPRSRNQSIIDRSNAIHKLTYNYILFIGKVLSFVGGIKSRNFLYRALQTWDTRIPIMAFSRDDKKAHSFILTDTNDCMWFNSYVYKGDFKIIGKTIGSRGNILLNCSWVSGDYSGKTFEMDEYLNILSEDFNSDDSTLEAAYLPPTTIVLIVELVVIITSITTIIKSIATF